VSGRQPEAGLKDKKTQNGDNTIAVSGILARSGGIKDVHCELSELSDTHPL
jgi:hypothetical protein